MRSAIRLSLLRSVLRLRAERSESAIPAGMRDVLNSDALGAAGAHILSMQKIRTGGCLCGALRFEARGVPRFIVNCHCGDCRKATGAAFSTWVGYDSSDVSWIGQRSIWKSSPDVQRGFCASCGTPLSYSGKQWIAETHLLIGVFDERADLAPTADAYAKEKLEWVGLIAG